MSSIVTSAAGYVGKGAVKFTAGKFASAAGTEAIRQQGKNGCAKLVVMCVALMLFIVLVRYSVVDWVYCVFTPASPPAPAPAGGPPSPPSQTSDCFWTHGIPCMAWSVGYLIGVFGALKLVNYLFSDVQQQTVAAFLASQQQTNRLLANQDKHLVELTSRVDVLREVLSFQQKHADLHCQVDREGAVVVTGKDGASLTAAQLSAKESLEYAVLAIHQKKQLVMDRTSFNPETDAQGSPVDVLKSLIYAVLEGSGCDAPKEKRRMLDRMAQSLVSPARFKLSPRNATSYLRLRYTSAWAYLKQYYHELRKQAGKAQARAQLSEATSAVQAELELDIEAATPTSSIALTRGSWSASSPAMLTQPLRVSDTYSNTNSMSMGGVRTSVGSIDAAAGQAAADGAGVGIKPQ